MRADLYNFLNESINEDTGYLNDTVAIILYETDNAVWYIVKFDGRNHCILDSSDFVEVPDLYDEDFLTTIEDFLPKDIISSKFLKDVAKLELWD